VVVVGDVNSTLACSLVACKEGYPVAHVEAGLRSFDERMPEEVNRRLCDHVSTYLYTPSRDADENLAREGIQPQRVVFVGNTMIDTLLRLRDSARGRRTPARLGLEPGSYAVVTLHRPENVDRPDSLRGLLLALGEVASRLPVVLPAHPRTTERIARFGLGDLVGAGGVRLTEPLGYLDFLSLVADARFVVTDSGGVQEETTVLGIPCLTVRKSTERPVTVASGTNTVIGEDPAAIVPAATSLLADAARPAGVPERWDGRAGERIVRHLRAELAKGTQVASERA
jgi:UDP-N-acetylglucosamine 2-epimerase (non-hydrolysing)